MSAGAKRKLKKMKMQGDESQQIVEQLQGLCMAHNIAVQFPWELPSIFGQILSDMANGGRHQVTAGHEQAVQSANSSLDRLRQIAGPRAIEHSPPPQGPARAPSPRAPAPPADPWDDELEEEEEVDPWEAAAAATLELMDEDDQDVFDEDYEESSHSPSGGMTEHEMMMRKYEEGQARMMERIATEGVSYKNGAPSPAAGKKLTPAPGVKVPQVEAQAPMPAPGPPQPGERRKMNGMTASEARNLISRVTGQEMKAPGGNPTPKPIG